MIYQDPKEQSARVYQEIEGIVNRTVESLNKINLNNDDGEKLRKDVLNDLKKIRNDFCEEFKFLKENSDWDELSIAFFGITGAGKSTLLEALRILYNEESRKEKIDENLKKLEKMEQERIQLESIKNELEKLDSNNRPSIDQIKGLLEQINQKMQFFPDEYNALKDLSDKKDEEISNKKNEINELEKENRNLYASSTTLSCEKNQLEQDKRRLEGEKNAFENKCNEAKKNYQNLYQSKSELDESYERILVENELLKKKYSKTRILLIVVFVILVVTGVILC